MSTRMKKKSFSKAIVRFVRRLKWFYDSLTARPVRIIHVDLGSKR